MGEDMKEPLELCAERLRKLGLNHFEITKKEGPFAAAVIDIETADPAAPFARMVYKQPAAGRWNEFPLFSRLGHFLSGWAPAVVAQFADEPRALIAEYAGEPISGVFQAAGRQEQELWLRRIVKRLAQLHASSASHIDEWMKSGIVEPYPFSTEWPEWALRQISRLEERRFPYDTKALQREIRRISEMFYPVFAQSIRCPLALTHGDPHMGNIVGDESSFVFIDWEWCNAATPVRDIAILLQDVHDERLAENAFHFYTDELLLGGCHANRDDVIHDFDLALVDNTIMMLAWDIELFMTGEKDAEELLYIIHFKRQRLGSAWERIAKRLNLAFE